MAKKFMYVCFGILALVAAFHLGAQYGRAETIVDHTATGIVALHNTDVLMEDGVMWQRNSPLDPWEEKTIPSLPVSVGEIKFWGTGRFVTNTNEVWLLWDGAWQNLGTPPSLVSTQPTTWGQIKAEFGE